MLSRKLISQIFGFYVGIEISASNILDFTTNSPNLSFKSDGLREELNFEIRFKCMSGLTTENAKFIMPLKEKMSYEKSFESCESFGFIYQFNNLS